ncbi:hypothetical protein O9993_09615 [Vibrio lentus]|nr:hypothetical protein [Vibrio lentus]
MFTLNTGHLVTAYHGVPGHETIKDSIEDDVIRAEVTATMEESGAVPVLSVTALIQKRTRHTSSPAPPPPPRSKNPCRFINPFLRDEVDRVGRQPVRKLSLKIALISH